MSTEKYKYWAAIMYPESLPEDWQEFLRLTGVAHAISPLHDRDVWDSTKDGHVKGEIKKEHYHVLLCWPGNTTYNAVVQRITKPLGQPGPISVVSPFGYYKYLWHDDADDKIEYDQDAVIRENGFDILSLISYTKEEEARLYTDAQQFIKEHNIYNYCDLCDMLDDLGDWEGALFVKKHTMFFNSYIKSRWLKYVKPAEDRRQREDYWEGDC